MIEMIYKIVVALSKRLGLWFFFMVSWIVAAWYFLFLPKRVMVSVRFYRALYPKKKGLYHLWCTWKQYHNFTHVYLDRFLLQDYDNISYTSQGWEYLKKTAESGKGGIIIMSHMGNWEVAAHILKRKEIKIMLYMGEKRKEQIERAQKADPAKSGIKIVAVNQDGGSPFDILEGINFLREGGLISLTGDQIWRKDQRIVPVKFLGHTVHLPETPHLFAMLGHAPLFIFFVFRTGKKHYHFSVSKPIYVKAASRSERKEAVSRSAQEYADLLEATVRSHPHEWFHFEPFLKEKLDE